MKRIIAFVSAVLLTGSAMAADLGGYKDGPVEAPCSSSNWTGFTLSALISADTAGASVSGSDFSVSYRDITIGGRLAYEYQFHNSPLVIGGFGELAYNGVANAMDINAVSESFGGTLGFAVGNVKPYVSLSGEFTDGFKESGVGFGGGVDFKLTQHLKAGLEWRRVNWSTDVSWVNVDEDRVTGRLGYQF